MSRDNEAHGDEDYDALPLDDYYNEECEEE